MTFGERILLIVGSKKNISVCMLAERNNLSAGLSERAITILLHTKVLKKLK